MAFHTKIFWRNVKFTALPGWNGMESAFVERANTAVRFIKTIYSSTTSENHFNALVSLYVHWDIK